MWEWTLIAAALWSVSWSPWMLPLALIVIGSRQHALGVLGHESVHRAIGGVPLRWSDRLGNALCMWPILSDVATYRRWHLAHHANLGTDRDPERAQRELFAQWYTNLTPARRALILAADSVGLHAAEPMSTLRVIMGPWTVWRWAHLAILASALIAVGGPLGLVAFFAALFSTFWASMRWRIWHEHLGPDVTLEYTASWWQRALCVPHYIWRHVDHHRAGRWSVPCWELSA